MLKKSSHNWWRNSRYKPRELQLTKKFDVTIVEASSIASTRSEFGGVPLRIELAFRDTKQTIISNDLVVVPAFTSNTIF